MPCTPVWEVMCCSRWRRLQDLASPALLLFGSSMLCKPQPLGDPPTLGPPSVSLFMCRGWGGQDSKLGLAARWVGAETPCSRTAEGPRLCTEPRRPRMPLRKGLSVEHLCGDRAPRRVCALVSDIIKVCWPQIRNKVTHPTGFRDDLGSQKAPLQPWSCT